jgi:hypothetical protein
MRWLDLAGFNLNLYEMYALESAAGIAWDQWRTYREHRRWGWN